MTNAAPALRPRSIPAVSLVVETREPTTTAPVTDRRRVRWSLAGLGVVVVATALLAGFQLRNGFLHVEPFFDEMWRIDMIHSSDVLARATNGGATPVPWGWIYLYKGLTPFIGGSPPAFRLASVALFACGMASLVVLLRRWAAPRTPSVNGMRLATAIAVATALTLPLLPAFAGLEQYFNNYLFEVAYAITLIMCCVEVPYRRWSFPAFLVGLVLAPLFVISSLVLLPVLFASVVSWAWRRDDRRARLAWLGGAAAGTLVVAGVVFLTLYRPITDASIELHGFWRRELLSTAGGDVFRVARSLEWLRDGVLSSAFPSPSGPADVLLIATLIGAFVVGAATITRRWAWYPALLVSGWVATLVGGAVLDAPVTPARVALGYWFLVYVTIVLGGWRALAWALERTRVATKYSLGVFAVATASVLVFLWPSAVLWPPAFAQGLLDDLDVVAHSDTRDNLVLSYHFMSQFYPHDRLVNDGPPGRNFVVIGERLHDETLYERVDDLVARYLPRGGTLWCVIPYAIGPRDSARACALNNTRAERFFGRRGKQAFIAGYRIPPR